MCEVSCAYLLFLLLYILNKQIFSDWNQSLTQRNHFIHVIVLCRHQFVASLDSSPKILSGILKCPGTELDSGTSPGLRLSACISMKSGEMVFNGHKQRRVKQTVSSDLSRYEAAEPSGLLCLLQVNDL